MAAIHVEICGIIKKSINNRKFRVRARVSHGGGVRWRACADWHGAYTAGSDCLFYNQLERLLEWVQSVDLSKRQRGGEAERWKGGEVERAEEVCANNARKCGAGGDEAINASEPNVGEFEGTFWRRTD